MTFPAGRLDNAFDPLDESVAWTARIEIAKYDGEITDGATPYEVIETTNLLMHGGASFMWQALLGNASATAGQALTRFDNTNAAIGVGDGVTAAVATQNNLVGTNRLRKGMNAGFPEHTDGTATANKQIRFQSTFGTTEANFAWQEVGVFNSATDAVGRMLNRRAESLGTKTSSSSWQVTISIDLA